jgi:hypothetical protein
VGRLFLKIPPCPPEALKKIGWRHFPVIPANPGSESGAGAGIQSRSERDFKPLRKAWTPAFTGVTTKRRIFYTFLFIKGGGIGKIILSVLRVSGMNNQKRRESTCGMS